jgi:predicted nuclease of predicted toxin-antitoxin system
MDNRIKFHLDENVSNAIALGLRRRGIDITTTAEVKLIGVTDLDQVNFALSQNRVIFTPNQESKKKGLAN